MFVAFGHYGTEATWNELCIVCRVRHAPLAVHWRSYIVDDQGMQGPPRIVTAGASR
jgi:hypothetical protein